MVKSVRKSGQISSLVSFRLVVILIYLTETITTIMSDSNLQCRCIDIAEPDTLLDTRAYLADMNGEMGWVFVYEGPETEEVRKIIQ